MFGEIWQGIDPNEEPFWGMKPMDKDLGENPNVWRQTADSC